MPGFTFTETQNTRPRVLRKGFLFVGVAANPSVETNVDLALPVHNLSQIKDPKILPPCAGSNIRQKLETGCPFIHAFQWNQSTDEEVANFQ